MVSFVENRESRIENITTCIMKVTAGLVALAGTAAHAHCIEGHIPMMMMLSS